jgi:hypothetical protein
MEGRLHLLSAGAGKWPFPNDGMWHRESLQLLQQQQL